MMQGNLLCSTFLTGDCQAAVSSQDFKLADSIAWQLDCPQDNANLSMREAGLSSEMELACRPAVVLSYGIAAVAALLSGLAYAELIVDMPLAGGAFSCILAVFSEPFAWYGSPRAAA